MCSLNVCGLKSKLKMPDFEKYIADFHIVAVCESNICMYDNIQVEGFKVIKTLCNKRKVGRISLLVCNNLAQHVSVIDTSTEVVIWFSLKEYSTTIIFGAMYIPPEYSPHSNIDIFDNIEQDLVELKSLYDCEICLFGDTNARTAELRDFTLLDNHQISNGDLEHNEVIKDFCMNESELKELNVPIQRHSCDKKANKYGRRLIDLCIRLNLFIVNGRVGEDAGIGYLTCKNASVVDYFICSPKLFPIIVAFKIDTFDPTLSDAHNPVSLSLGAYPYPNENTSDLPERKPQCGKPIPRPKWDIDKGKDFVKNINVDEINALLEGLEVADSSGNVTGDLINNIVTGIENTFNTSARSCGIQKPRHNSKKKKPNKPWFNKDCQDKRKAFMKAKKACGIDNNSVTMTNLKHLGQSYKRATKRAYKEYHEKLAAKLRTLKSNRPKEYWDIIKEAGKCQVSQKSPCAEDLFKHFKELNECPLQNTLLEDTSAHEGKNNTLPNNDSLNRIINEDEIKLAINKLNNNKACGLDGIINEYIKSTEIIFMPLYTKLFNVILDTGIIPHSWSLGKIVPIYKNKGDPEKADSYRGITILSCLGKLFTSILNTRIEEYIKDANILGLEQAGFRKEHSTVDHMFMLKCLVDLYLQKHKRLYCAFVDYEKAFDKVDRALLWLKLIDNNVNGKILKVIMNLYSQAKSCVANGGSTTAFFNCEAGVRQGENLSPVLFALYLNDLKTSLSSTLGGLTVINDILNNIPQIPDIEVLFKMFILLYADDTTVLSDSPDALQQGLNAMSKYCCDWKLKVNVSKTKIVIFSRGKVRKRPLFTYNGIPIEIVDEFIFLGTLFNFNGKFNKARKHACNQATKAMFAVISKARKLNLPIDIQLHLFDSVIQPILLYGCEVWGIEDCKDIERLHLKFCKTILGVSQYTSSAMIYGELGRVPLSVAIKTRIVSYWHRLLTCPTQKLASTMYNIVSHITHMGFNELKWSSYVKSILDECGLGYIWLNQHTTTREVSTSWLKAKVKTSLCDQFSQNWQEMIDTNKNCQAYKCLKSTHGVEQYLLRLPFNCRNIICKFRCRNFYLPASPRIFYTEYVENNKCTLCNQNAEGDELHYVLKCPALNDARHSLLNIKEGTELDAIKFANVVSSTDTNDLVKLAKFLWKLSKLLKEKIII